MTIHANPSREVFFSDHEIIVSKTDLKGRITCANATFCRAMAEEATAACKSLANESELLARMVAAFTLSVVARNPSLAEGAAARSTNRRVA